MAKATLSRGMLLIVWALTGCEAQGDSTTHSADPPTVASRNRNSPRRVEWCDRSPRHPLHAIRVLENLPYAPEDGFSRHLDLALPPGRGPFPLVVMFHAGGWANGDENQLATHIRRLAQHGFAAASVRYRLANRAPLGGGPRRYPAAISDARCSLRFLASRTDRYNLSTASLVTMGFSAGGHLATLTALAPTQSLHDDGTCPVQQAVPAVAGVVSYYGVYDLQETSPIGEVCHRIVNNFIGSRANAREKASPIHYASDAAPPVLLIHGTEDNVVRIESARSFDQTLVRNKTPSLLVEVEQAGHGLPFLEPGSPVQHVDCTVLEFLKSRATELSRSVGLPAASRERWRLSEGPPRHHHRSPLSHGPRSSAAVPAFAQDFPSSFWRLSDPRPVRTWRGD